MFIFMAYKSNIEEETLNNSFYRKVLFTGDKMQLVVMSLKEGEDIPLEVHKEIDQFIRVEKGKAEVTVDGEKFELSDDDVIIIPSGSEHRVCNVGDSDLKVYTIYSPPEHSDGTIHKTKEEADSAEHEH